MSLVWEWCEHSLRIQSVQFSAPDYVSRVSALHTKSSVMLASRAALIIIPLFLFNLQNHLKLPPCQCFHVRDHEEGFFWEKVFMRTCCHARADAIRLVPFSCLSYLLPDVQVLPSYSSRRVTGQPGRPSLITLEFVAWICNLGGNQGANQKLKIYILRKSI